MWLCCNDGSGNYDWVNSRTLKKSVADGKNTLLSTVSKYWSEASNWDANGTNGKPIPNWGNLSEMITNVYNKGLGVGGSGKYKVVSGTVSRSQSSGNIWINESISTGLSSISGGMGVVTGTYGVPNGYVCNSASGGTMVLRGIGFNGNVTIQWIAYGQ